VPAPTNWWDDLYRSSDVADLPWYTPLLDSDFELALKRYLPKGGRVLDLGTGPATQAIALAKRGYEVVASDVAPSAIEKGKGVASRENVRIDFRVDNILDSKLEDGLVEAIVDRGVFHVMPPESRPHYVAAVRRILRPRGYLFLKAFSDKEPRQEGPYHIGPEELRARFEGDFEVLSIEDAAFQGSHAHAPKSLFAILRRR